MTVHLLGLTPVQIIAKPAATIGRAFTDIFAGIAPASVPGFVATQLVGGLVAVAAWYPHAADSVGAVVVPHLTQKNR
ncbi:hypothetical protein ACH4T9_01445 [Micromonospora sp. NPDC020750]|uniref:hypothetical protein n=1 Tax=unclassified Micromonospora TaxID=2617518 RepID=UPI0037BDE333